MMSNMRISCELSIIIIIRSPLVPSAYIYIYGALDGGTQCRMSILRNGNVALLILGVKGHIYDPFPLTGTHASHGDITRRDKRRSYYYNNVDI